MKSMSCSLDRSSFGTFWVILLSFLALSLPVQSCRLNQNVLAQAACLNQRVQSETNRLNLPDREGANKLSFNRSIPQATIQNMSPTSIGDQQLKKAEVIQKTAKLQMPFIANNGQMDERVKFYANTFGGTVFVTEDGEIVYSLPGSRTEDASSQLKVGSSECRGELHSPGGISPLKRGTHPLIPSREGIGVCNTTPTTRRDTERRVPTATVALKEEFVGAKVKAIQGEEKSVTKVNYFKGKDPSKWKTNISTYDVINLGEVYDGIELKLKAYGSNVEKLFCVKPGADPRQIKVRLSGVNPQKFPLKKGGYRGLLVNEHGELEVETELGPVKFTKPKAYQEIDSK